jgi:hypothetical protein
VLSTKRTLDFQRQTLARPFINHRQTFEFLTICASIEDKIVGSDLIRSARWQWSWPS